MRAGYLLDPDGQVSTLHGTQETNLSCPTSCGRERRPSRRSPTSASATCRSTTPAGPLAPTTSWRSTRHAAMPDVPAATLRHRQPHAQCGLAADAPGRASSAATSSSSTRPPARRDRSSGTGPTSPKASCGAYGDQNMTWQALRDVARARPATGPTGRSTPSTPTGTAPGPSGRARRATPNGCGATSVSTGDLATVRSLYPSVTRAVTWLWSTRQAATGLLYGLADTDNGDPVYGYDLSVAADTVSNVLAVNAMRRLAQLATVAGDDAAARPGRPEPPSWPTPSTRVLRRSDGTYVDGVDANGAPEQPRLAGGQRAGARLRRRAGLRPRRGRGLRGRPRHRRRAQPRSRAPARAGGGGHARGDGAHAHRHVHPGLGPHCGGRRDLHLGGLDDRATSSGTPCRTAGAPPRWWPCRRPCSGSTLGSPKRTAPSGRRLTARRPASPAPRARCRPSPGPCWCPGSAGARA